MGCDRHPYPGRLCVITCERTVISTVLPSLDERQVRHSHVIGPLVEGRGKENGRVCFDMFCLSLFPPFLSLRLSPVDYGSLFPMRLCLQDRCVKCGAKVQASFSPQHCITVTRPKHPHKQTHTQTPL